MALQLLWTGLTFIMASHLLPFPVLEMVGEVLMIVGTVLLWVGR